MPKPLDDLDLGNTPVQSDYQAEKLEARRMIRVIEEMEKDPDFLWANDTLSGIRVSIGLAGRVTSGQHEAIKNIQRAAETRGDKPRGRRRYE